MRKVCYPCLSRLLNLPPQLNWSIAVKLKAQTISHHIYSKALLPSMSCIASKILHSLRGLPNISYNMATGRKYRSAKTWQCSWWLKKLSAHIAAERFLQAFRAVTLEASRTCFWPPTSWQTTWLHAWSMHNRPSVTCDVAHRFEENNKSGIVLADLTTAHDSQLYGTKPKHPTDAFD